MITFLEIVGFARKSAFNDYLEILKNAKVKNKIKACVNKDVKI